MSNYDHHHSTPHKSLGRFLKTMRQQLQESLGETSGAVEIGVEQLDRFERGAELPSEDILMLLISHFNLQDDEAVRLWEMAGYDRRSEYFDIGDDHYQGQDNRPLPDDQSSRQPVPVVLLALDTRIMYANGAEIVTDDMGVVLNFSQSDSSNQVPVTVSRVGMSYEQAEQLLQIMQRALLHRKYTSGPKQLPPQTN